MSLVALALPQNALRMKTMAAKGDNPPLGTGEDPATILPKVKVKKDKYKRKEAVKALVETSSPAISILLPDTHPAMFHSTHSAPSSPGCDGSHLKQPKNRRARLRLPRLSSPLGRKKHANSDPESCGTTVSPLSPSPSPSPTSTGRSRFAFMRPNRKKHSSCEMNGDKTPSPNRSLSRKGTDCLDSSNSPIEPEATSVTTLPGQVATRNSGGEIPTIFISGEGVGGEVGNRVELDGEVDHHKMSETAQGSPPQSGNSGYCSQLSPTCSGDEYGSYSESDCPSPLSPSIVSSPVGSASDITIAAEKNGSRPVRLVCVSSLVSPDSESELQLVDVSQHPSTRGTSPLSEGDGRRLLGGLEGRHRKKSKPWESLRKFVQALSPFTLQFNKKRYQWVQLGGHEGSFFPGAQAGSIQKKSDHRESDALKALASDCLKSFVPEYIRTVEVDNALYIEMADLLREFTDPVVMDIKMGVRTYLEEELEKAKSKKVLRNDMYEKMIAVDPNEPTPEEHSQKAITKLHYMQWREAMSSSSSLGFRIEGIKTSEGKALKDFKTTKQVEEVKAALRDFVSENTNVKEPLLRRLYEIRSCLERSPFFHQHEVIGSSLLFVYDSTDLSSIHLIDFGKTTPLPEGLTITHDKPWEEGNHEDGYLWGLDNLIALWREL